MRNIFSGTRLAEDSRKRHAERTRETQENQMVGRSRRQREMDDAYDERRSKLKRAMLEKQENDSMDYNKVIGRPKGLMLVPPSEHVEECEGKALSHPSTMDTRNKGEENSSQKKETPNVVKSETPPAQIDPNAIYTKLLKGLRSPSPDKYRTVVGMVARLMGAEGHGWLSDQNTEQLVDLLYTTFMSGHLRAEKHGGDARAAVNNLLVNVVESTIIQEGLIILPSENGSSRVTFSQDQRDRLNLALLRARILIQSFNDDSLIVQGAISRLLRLVEQHHKEKVDEMVRKGELNAYEAVAQTSTSITDALALSDRVSLESHETGILKMEKEDLTLTELRERVIEDGLECYFDLMKVAWAQRDVRQLFLKAYHYKTDFNSALDEKIANWQSMIKDGSALGRTSSGVPRVQQAGVAGHTVVDARIDRISFSSGADTWAAKQKGVL